MSWPESKYLTFRKLKSLTKTERWEILAKSDETVLATVRWYGPWRQYVMNPEPEMLFNIGCLRGICSFLDWLNKKQRATWKRPK